MNCFPVYMKIVLKVIPCSQHSHSHNHEYHFMSVRTEQNSIWHAVNGHCNSVTTVSPTEERRSSLYSKPCS